MTNSEKIVDLLNELISLNPETARLLDSGIPANQALIDSDIIITRETIEGEHVTTTGIISAIGRLLGQEILSIYDIDDKHVLTGFKVAEKCNESKQTA